MKFRRNGQTVAVTFILGCCVFVASDVWGQGLFGFWGRRDDSANTVVVPESIPKVRPKPQPIPTPTPVPTPFPPIPALKVPTQGTWNPVDGTAVSYGGVYGGHIWNNGLSVGGIGTGAVELLPDGRFANGTLLNNYDNPVSLPGMVMAVSVKTASKNGHAALLCLDSARARLDNPALASLPSARIVKAQAAWPFMRLDFEDPEMFSPVQVRMNAWSPMVPGKEKDSTYPGMVVELDLYNPTDRPAAVGAQLFVPNVIGKGGTGTDGDSFSGWPNLRHDAVSTSGLSGILMQPASEVLPNRQATFAGTLFAGVDTSGVLVNRTLHRDLDEPSLPWWGRFTDAQRPQKDAEVKDGDSWSTPEFNIAGSGRHGVAVGCSLHLAPKERRLVPFVVAWNAPAVYPRTKGNPVLQTMTGARWPNAYAAAVDLMSNRYRLRRQTVAWHRLLMESNYPTALKVRLVNDLSVLTANTLLLADGRFMQLPAAGSGTGIAGTLAHRVESDGALAALFPRLEAVELSQFAEKMDEQGNLPPMLGNFHEGLTMPADVSLSTGRVDLPGQFTVAVAALARAYGDAGFAQAMLPKITRALVKMQAGGDTSVYSTDTATSGASGYGTGLRVAALRAGAWIQAAEGKDTSSLCAKADELSAKFQKDLLRQDGAPRLDVSGEAAFASALTGDWMLRGPLCGLTPLLNDKSAQRAVQAMLKLHVPSAGDSSVVINPVVGADGRVFPNVVHLPPLLAQFVAESLLVGADVNTVMVLLERFINAGWNDPDPWHRSLRYNPQTGKAVSANASPTVMASWRVAEAVNGFSYDPGARTIYFNPHVPPTMNGKLNVPVFTPLLRAMLTYDEKTQKGDVTILSMTPPDGHTGPYYVERIVPGVNVYGHPTPERKLDSPVELKSGTKIPLRRKPILLELE